MSWRVVVVALRLFLPPRLVGVGLEVVVLHFMFVGAKAPAMPTVAAGVTVAVGVSALRHYAHRPYSFLPPEPYSSPHRAHSKVIR
jgi:hypothetical protein